MNQFHKLFRWAWSVIVICALAFAMGGCEGDDGAPGAQGPQGPVGDQGPPGPGLDPIAAAIDAANVESCSTCHEGVGGGHQAIYEGYIGPSNIVLTFVDFRVTPNAALFDVELDFTITFNGQPYDDYAGLPQKRFYATQYDAATGTYINGNTSLNDSVVNTGPGAFTLSEAGLSFDPTVNGQVYGYIAKGELFAHDSPTSEGLGSHVHLYDDVSNAALAYGDAAATSPNAYVSPANVAGCTNCHGDPYLKHGYRAAEVNGLPDFAACKSCHYDDRNGNHSDWQYMVDEPFNWATGVPETADYSYKATIMNDVHMSHAMEFPYPMSMQNCNTCHEGKLAQILDDSQFNAVTCKSCHPVQGIDAWPEDAGTTTEGIYAQPHRAPPLEFLWARANVVAVHNFADINTVDCAGQCHGGNFSSFSDYHTGYDDHIYDATGTKFADLNTVAIESIDLAGNTLTVNFTANNTAIVPELLVSFYGWDTKHFIVASHTSDGSTLCLDRRGNPGGCRMEYEPGDTNPLFSEDAASVAGDWIVTLDFGAYVPTEQLPETIPEMIANGTIKKVEVTVTPTLRIAGERVVLVAVNDTVDLATGAIVADYFKGANATVTTVGCNKCHDTLASTFHDGSGRGGDGVEVCKNCHVTTTGGSHMEMQSRSIESYVHAIHSFQPFDEDDVAAANDPVFTARNEMHKQHTFPNFTIRNCEACHLEGTYNVPDQSKSMFGLSSRSYSIASRNIGSLPEYVMGPASRACGGCHRADLINADLAGDLASFNAHTGTFGTLEENDSDDFVLYGVIDKIMSLFE